MSSSRQYRQPAFQLPRPSRAVLGLIAVQVVGFIAFALLLRQSGRWATLLPLSAEGVFGHGYLWQPLTGLLVEHPDRAVGLLVNCAFTWLFGSVIEGMLGTRRLLTTFVGCGLAGAALALLVGGLAGLLPEGLGRSALWEASQLGASGAVMGLTFAWIGLLWGQRLHFLLLGEMEVRAFAIILLAMELVFVMAFGLATALPRLGGMAMGFAIGRGRWPPRKRSVAPPPPRARFEVLEGGRTDEPTNGARPPRGWGSPPVDENGDPIVH